VNLALPNPSSRLQRAAAAEQADLTRHRERLARERERLVAELRQVDEAMAAADQRMGALARLIEPPDGIAAAVRTTLTTQAAGMGEAPDATHDESRRVLRGPAIREVAVQVLIAQPEHIEALHYRRWYELVTRAGYAVAGKDPLAVFLTQMSRSPVVRKATEPGVYELDRQAPLRIRQRLERLQTELREATVAPHSPIELASVRARRHELDLAISQQERALEEALRVLRRDGPDVSAVGGG
jgi:hypothetical protein